MGLFDNRDEGIMAFEELLNFGATPAQLRWTFDVLAVEGSPALSIWECHEKSLSADIRDRLLRTTASPNPDVVRNEVLLAIQSLLQGLGRSLPDFGLPEPTERQEEIDAERLRWSGDPTNLCAFKDGLTAEQVKNLSLHSSNSTLKNCSLLSIIGSCILPPWNTLHRSMLMVVLDVAKPTFSIRSSVRYEKWTKLFWSLHPLHSLPKIIQEGAQPIIYMEFLWMNTIRT
jgi:hypothetical protein